MGNIQFTDPKETMAGNLALSYQIFLVQEENGPLVWTGDAFEPTDDDSDFQDSGVFPPQDAARQHERAVQHAQKQGYNGTIQLIGLPLSGGTSFLTRG